MSHLENSKIWIDYLDNHFEDCSDYFRFAMVWMSFNSYYATRYKDIDYELNQILEFAKDNEKIYQNLRDSEFIGILEEFKKTGWLYGEQGERDCVKNMKVGATNKRYFKESNRSCKDFFKVTYQIRCNLFHGSKEVSDPGNKKLVGWAYKYLSIFWKKYLSDNS